MCEKSNVRYITVQKKDGTPCSTMSYVKLHCPVGYLPPQSSSLHSWYGPKFVDSACAGTIDEKLNSTSSEKALCTTTPTTHHFISRLLGDLRFFHKIKCVLVDPFHSEGVDADLIVVFIRHSKGFDCQAHLCYATIIKYFAENR